MHTIYLVRKDDKPVYVGYTSRSVEKRWQEHICDSNNPKFPLHHAIKKHGVSAFTIETLYESEDSEHTLNYMEHHYIWLCRTHKSLGGYNVAIGGEGVLMSMKRLTEEEQNEREKIRKRTWRRNNKAYFESNKDKIKTREKTYYEANKDKIKAAQKIYREANKDKIKAAKKIYREANKDKIKAAQKIYREAKKGSVDFSTDPGSEVPCAG
jgi:hypothetical protein